MPLQIAGLGAFNTQGTPQRSGQGMNTTNKQTPSTGGQGEGHNMRTAAVRSVWVVVAFFLTWEASALFEVRPNVSALYFVGGVTFSVAVLFGARYLLPAFFALALIQAYDVPDASLHEFNWLSPLRQTLIYGVAGLSMRHLWLAEAFRLSLPIAIRFLLTAFAASLLSAAFTLRIPPFNTLPPEVIAEVFFSFWGGDFAGVMVTVPIVLMLHHTLALARRATGGSWRSVVLERLGLHDALWLTGIGVGVTLFAIFTPHLLGADVRIDVLILLPVLLAGLWRGALAGFAVAVQVCLLEVFVRPLLGMPIGLTIDLQMLIVMSAAVALLAGAAHDDKQFEWRRANFDALSGLANRSCFEDRLNVEFKRSWRNQHPFALLYLDLDGFKAINDTLGHRTGDDLLRQTAVRLSSAVRETDTVARLGGDEFAIILSEADDPQVVERLAQSLVEAVASPYLFGAETAMVSVSIGIAYSPKDGASPVELMHAADQAMYAAKAQGKNRFVLAKTKARS
jgi:diguanylate cyclase (GGDEF)-like protein